MIIDNHHLRKLLVVKTQFLSIHNQTFFVKYKSQGALFSAFTMNNSFHL